jgi:magnesium transporter
LRLDHQLGVAAPRVGTLQHGRLTWLVVERPTPDEIVQLGERLGLSHLTREDLVLRGEPVRLERHEGYDFAVLRFPVMLTRPRRLGAAELRLAVGRDWVLTVHDGDLRPLVGLFDDLQLDDGRRAEVMESAAGLAHTVVRMLLAASAGWSERLAGGLRTLEDGVFGGPASDAPRQLLQARSDLADVDRIVRPLPGLLDQLALGDAAARWRDAADLARRQIDQLDEASTTLDGLDRALGHELARRRNVMLRAVAVVLAATLPAILVAVLYGSGLRGLPGSESEWAFEIALGLALLAGVGTVGILRRADWV